MMQQQKFPQGAPQMFGQQQPFGAPNQFLQQGQPQMMQNQMAYQQQRSSNA